MSERLIAEIAAGVGVLATVLWLVLGVKGIRTLRDILGELRKKP